MTAELREYLRRELDRRARQRVAIENARDGVKECARCGTPLDCRNPSCAQCRDRHMRRWRRTNDPGFRERERAYSLRRRLKAAA